MPPRRRERLSLIQSSVTDRDQRLAGLDALVLMEVIEHIDQPRLAALERTVFAEARPEHVVVTTPNSEYNIRFEFLSAGRCGTAITAQWTRPEFAAGPWPPPRTATSSDSPVGQEDPEVSSPP
jgi:hypothetical protein